MIFIAQIALKIHQKALSTEASPGLHLGNSNAPQNPYSCKLGLSPRPCWGANGNFVEVGNLMNREKFHLDRATIVLILARVSVYIRSLQCIAI
jgi:hypothetical protein